MKAITIAHVSDLHLAFDPTLSAAQRLSKRQLSAWSWQRRRRRVHRSAILDQLAADLRSHEPDHIVVTGDLTNFALAEEFAHAACWLAALAPPDRISVVPGNHDALVPVPTSEGLGRWSAWTRAEDGWPFVHYRDHVALIGLDSAVPTAPLLARGRLGAQQLARLERVLDDEGRAGRVRIVLLHHPVADRAASWRRALADRAELRDVLRRSGAELVLHGHARHARLDAIAGPQGQRGMIPCVCVPSSSAEPSRSDEGARWHCMRFSGDERSPRTEVLVRRWSPNAQAFVDAARYELCLPRRAAGVSPRDHAHHAGVACPGSTVS